MKNTNNSTFNIEMTTMRELNPDEINEVGGGTMTPSPLITITASFILSCFDSCPDNQEK